MTWKEQIVVKILCIIAKMFADEEMKQEIQTLHNHIMYGDKD